MHTHISAGCTHLIVLHPHTSQCRNSTPDSAGLTHLFSVLTRCCSVEKLKIIEKIASDSAASGTV